MGNQSIVIKTDRWEKKTFWFNTENQFVNTSDLSQKRELIKKKKRELEI